MKKTLSMSLLMAACAGAFAQPAEPVRTLGQAVTQAINAQPEVQVRWHAFLASSEDRDVVRGGYRPSIDVDAGVGRANREFDGQGWFNRHSAELSLTQVLFDGYRLRSKLAQADHNRLARFYELLDTIEEKALEAVLAYEDVTRYRATHELARRNYATHQDIHRKIDERAAKGVGNRADLQQAAGRLALARANLLTEEANLHDVTARFQRIVGSLPADAISGHDVTLDRLPAEFRLVMDEALRNNPALYAAFEGIRAAEAAARESRSAHYPRLTLNARHGYYQNTNSFDARFDPRSFGRDTVVELRASYNLFRGGSDEAAQRAAQRRVEQSRSLQDKACVDLQQTASIAWNDLANLRSKLTALETHRDGARLVVKAYEDQFDIGRRTLLDTLDARNEAFQSERALVHGQSDLRKAYYRTLHAMGRLVESLGVGRDGLPAIHDFDEAAERPAEIACQALASRR